MAGVQGLDVVLLCGTELSSNPPATISWSDSNGNVMDFGSTKFQLHHDSSSVSLLVRKLVEGDTGTWTCMVHVEDVQTVRHSIALTVVGKQENLIGIMEQVYSLRVEDYSLLEHVKSMG